jgi:hypothetical protein
MPLFSTLLHLFNPNTHDLKATNSPSHPHPHRTLMMHMGSEAGQSTTSLASGPFPVVVMLLPLNEESLLLVVGWSRNGPCQQRVSDGVGGDSMREIEKRRVSAIEWRRMTGDYHSRAFCYQSFIYLFIVTATLMEHTLTNTSTTYHHMCNACTALLMVLISPHTPHKSRRGGGYEATQQQVTAPPPPPRMAITAVVATIRITVSADERVSE